MSATDSTAATLHFVMTPSKAHSDTPSQDEYATDGPAEWDCRIVYPDGTAKCVNTGDSDGARVLALEVIDHREHVQIKPGCEAWANNWFFALAEKARAATAAPAPAPEPAGDTGTEWPEAAKPLVAAVNDCDDLDALDALRKRETRNTVTRAIENRMAALVYPDAPYAARARAAWVGQQTDVATIRAMLAAGKDYGLAENRPSVTKVAQDRLTELTAAPDDADPFLASAALHKTAKGVADWVATQTDADGIERLMKADKRRTVKTACEKRLIDLHFAGNPAWPIVKGPQRTTQVAIAGCTDVEKLRAALEIEQGQYGKKRSSVVADIEARIVALESAAPEPAEPAEPETPEPETTEPPAADDNQDDSITDSGFSADDVRVDASMMRKGKVSEVKGRIEANPHEDDPQMAKLVAQAVLDQEKAEKRPRKGVVAAAEAWLDRLSPADDEEDEDEVSADDLGTTDTQDVRPEIAGTIEGVGGMNELGGDIEGNGTTLGGGLGSGENELGGGLGSSDDPDEIEGDGDSGNVTTHKRAGAGCKQPHQVLADQGVYPGQVLTVTKAHRQAGWGRCDYTIKVEMDCTFRLIGFNGARETWVEGDTSTPIVAESVNGKRTGQTGKTWEYSSEMFWDLLGIERGENGKGVKHHKQTLRRYFKLKKAQE